MSTDLNFNTKLNFNNECDRLSYTETNIDERDMYGRTRLMCAKTLDEALWFLYAGADVNARSHTGQTPIYFVNDPEIAKLLLKRGADPNVCDWLDRYTPLMEACARNNFAITKLLIKYGALVNTRNIYDEISLMLTDNEKIAQLLIDNGVDIDAKSVYGRSTLFSVNRKIIDLLIAKGVDPNEKDNDGILPLLYYQMNTYEQIKMDVSQLNCEKTMKTE